MFYAILAVVLVILDQIVKYLIRAKIPLCGSIPFIPYIMDLTYVQNTGAAFSMLRQHTWLLTLTSAVVVAAMCALVITGFFKNRLGMWSAALVLAGGVGNLIDRAVFGYVTDMFKTTFINFAVFNVADCCITVGVPLLFLYVLLYVGRDEKEEIREEKAVIEECRDEKSEHEKIKGGKGKTEEPGNRKNRKKQHEVQRAIRGNTKKKRCKRKKGGRGR